MVKLKTLKEQWIKNPEFQKEYEKLKPEFEMAREFIRARISANMTQAEVANKMQTTQSAIARLESGKAIPTLKTIERYAKAVGMRFQIQFVSSEKSK